MKLGILALAALLATALVVSTASAGGNGHGTAPGVGVCPNPGAPDADGDGIPNGQDPDYVAPGGGTGRQAGRTSLRSMFPFASMPFVFQGPFGVLVLSGPRSIGLMPGGYGPGDCTGNDGDGPGDGTGFGPGFRR